MRAINDEGLQIVNHAIETRMKNKLYLIDSLRAAIKYIEQHAFELAKGPLLNAYELTLESLRCTFICVAGLEPLVVNELSDAQNYNQLDVISNKIYKLYAALFRLTSERYEGENIFGFQKYKILRDPNLSDLEKEIKIALGKYSYEVEYHNLMHREPYPNKYGIPTPLQYRAGLSLANFMANGVPTENHDTAVPKGKHPVTSQSMDVFIKSFESLLQGHPSRKDIEQFIAYDPNPEELITSIGQAMKK